MRPLWQGAVRVICFEHRPSLPGFSLLYRRIPRRGSVDRVYSRLSLHHSTLPKVRFELTRRRAPLRIYFDLTRRIINYFSAPCPVRLLSHMVGEVGFEPTNTGSQCLIINNTICCIRLLL